MIFNSIGKLIVGALTFFAAMALQSCAPGRALKTDVALSSDIQGTYTLILYGGNYSDDFETVAFLDREGDRFTFEPYAPEFVFRSAKGLTADRALRQASEFIRSHPEIQREQVRSIRDEKGEIIGYEVRPLYIPIAFGTDDVIDIDYWLKENRVLIYVKLKPFLEQRRQDIDSDSN